MELSSGFGKGLWTCLVHLSLSADNGIKDWRGEFPGWSYAALYWMNPGLQFKFPSRQCSTFSILHHCSNFEHALHVARFFQKRCDVKANRQLSTEKKMYWICQSFKKFLKFYTASLNQHSPLSTWNTQFYHIWEKMMASMNTKAPTVW